MHMALEWILMLMIFTVSIVGSHIVLMIRKRLLKHISPMTARKMIERMGYHRRDNEVNEIERQLS